VGWSSGLEQAKRICLQLAWEAFGAGSVPVGAVVLDGLGAVVASGRSRMYEPTAPAPELANSLLAHAEVNALVGLDPRRRYDDHALVTALEPCPLCIGALAMSTVGTLVYLAADPYGGAVGRLSDTAHTARVQVKTYGPSRDGLSTLISALHVACYLQRNPNGSVVRFHQDRHPDVVDAGSALLAAGAGRQAQSGVPFGHVVDSLLAVVP
jgi:tRNA(adenine34) deaminase